MKNYLEMLAAAEFLIMLYSVTHSHSLDVNCENYSITIFLSVRVDVCVWAHVRLTRGTWISHENTMYSSSTLRMRFYQKPSDTMRHKELV